MFKINVEKKAEEDLARRWLATEFSKPAAAPAPAPSAPAASGPAGDGDDGPADGGGKREKPKPIVAGEKDHIGRNEPCHCGSGKKFKKCHGRV
ncbi:MAG: SEC-C domain-containing protein [Planctomycetes bacterium]|nr:SEC-C domain-containing protein [Planctomycetota bacterium]